MTKKLKNTKIIGTIQGIIATSENPFILIETSTRNLVECYYSDQSFKPDLTIPDLRVMEDTLLLIGTFIPKRKKRTKDQLVNVKEIYKIIFDVDYNDPRVMKDLWKYAKSALIEDLDENHNVSKNKPEE